MEALQVERHVGTVAELSAIEPHIVKEVYREALRIVSMLDEQFGEERNVENDDGGIVFIVLNEEELRDRNGSEQ